MLPAVAGAHDAAHTLRFVSALTKRSSTPRRPWPSKTPTSPRGQDHRVRRAVRHPDGKTTGTADIAYAENGGLIYGALTLTHNGARAHGTVTGGPARSRATGTITAKPANKSGTHSAVTITYTG